MAFDMGFNFRGTSGYVTDPAYGVPVLAELYPNTYTNSNGDSINAGWDTNAPGTADRSTGVDVRLAGINFNSPSVRTFKVDLSSGSAPGAGDYTIDMAVGDVPFSHAQDITVKDTSTTLIAFTGTSGAGEFFDATGTLRSPGTSSWDLVAVTVAKTFATTLCTYAINDNSGAVTLAHFRLTLGGGAAADVRFEHIAYGIGRGILLGR